MIRKILAIASIAALGTIIVACASDDDSLADPASPSTPDGDEDITPHEYTWERPTGEVGTNRRKVSGKKCCYEDKFYTCPTAADCLGGFDFDACVTACGDDEECAHRKCRDQFYRAKPPTSNCVEGKMPEPLTVPEDEPQGEREGEAEPEGEAVDDANPEEETIEEDDPTFTCEYTF